MKRMLFLVLVVILQSCGDKKTEARAQELVVEEKESIDMVVNTSEEKITTYNFAELEPLFNKSNDTTYVINFWATWCKPCVKELPYFEKLTADYKNEKLKVILVSLDFPDKLETHVIPFVEKHKLQSEVVLLDDPDANSWIPKVSNEWEGAIPATLIYKGTNKRFHEGSLTQEELDTEVKLIL